jgi:hypothetical protein
MTASLFSMTFVLPPLLLCEDVQYAAHVLEEDAFTVKQDPTSSVCCPRGLTHHGEC